MRNYNETFFGSKFDNLMNESFDEQLVAFKYEIDVFMVSPMQRRMMGRLQVVAIFRHKYSKFVLLTTKKLIDSISSFFRLLANTTYRIGFWNARASSGPLTFASSNIPLFYRICSSSTGSANSSKKKKKIFKSNSIVLTLVSVLQVLDRIGFPTEAIG